MKRGGFVPDLAKKGDPVLRKVRHKRNLRLEKAYVDYVPTSINKRELMMSLNNHFIHESSFEQKFIYCAESLFCKVTQKIYYSRVNFEMFNFNPVSPRFVRENLLRMVHSYLLNYCTRYIVST